ncbi:hypothetical protein M409DRAFT_63886 [Zasmidium cellare ATCC 36951]|uniref:Aminotransferase class V domain-containing protein n=1 Tax=Zasmidium cellare ATCC 36951 TaxID=1080233 RepID=A0A6A6CYF6_ZASCE|nr:uncharacterized protein M409DRAFT_63886 [Zasmidium cellare ATCC 36951]KAF2170839.1 hypothetical protein M409DRAFT_63886 [Zasmidium cellare ATCC 36951]
MSKQPKEEGDLYTVIDSISTIECGKEAAQHFYFDDGWRNLNHGSYGTLPREVGAVARYFHEQSERRPDWFIRYESRLRNDEARAAIAQLINAPVDSVVFVPNATTELTLFLIYQPGDVIIHFSSVFDSCHKTIEYLVETTPVQAHGIRCDYPITDADLVARFEEAIQSIRASGKSPKLAIFDTVVSLPGVRVPFEILTGLCRRHGIFSVLDAAHSVGHISLDLTTLDPDFFVLNCHKWLFARRGCAVMYVAARNHPLMRSSLPTSNGFVPQTSKIAKPTTGSANANFITLFEFVGTIDKSPYLAVPAALKWRSKVVFKHLKGEDAVRAYCFSLAREGGDRVASILDTEVLDNEQGTLRQCAFANSRSKLHEPLFFRPLTLVREYNTFMPIFMYVGEMWVRLSAQIYLTIEDFEWAGRALREVSERHTIRPWHPSKS